MCKDIDPKSQSGQKTEDSPESLPTSQILQEYNRPPVQLSGEELPYLYDLDFKKDIKYPKFSYYMAETFFLLFKNRYQDRPELRGNFSFGYGGAAWDPFKIIFIPGVIRPDGEFTEDGFHPDNHEALTKFFEDLQSINDDPEINIFEDKKNRFNIEVTNPRNLLELLKIYLNHFNVPTKTHSLLSREALLRSGIPEDKVLEVLKSQFEEAATNGELIYENEYTANTSMGNLALRFCENRPYSSLKSVLMSIAISSELDLQASIEELTAILLEETCGDTKPAFGHNLVN